MSEKQMFEWIQEAIISCDDKIDVVTTRRISGASRTAVADDDTEELIPNPEQSFLALKTVTNLLRLAKI
jgi:hypothetical protein